MQVLSQNDKEECEAVLKALKQDPKRKMKLNEMNEEGLTLIHCTARCDGVHSSSSLECTRLQSLQKLLEIGAGKPKSLTSFFHEILPNRGCLIEMSL